MPCDASAEPLPPALLAPRTPPSAVFQRTISDPLSCFLGNAVIAVGGQEHHLTLPAVRTEGPAVAEHHRLFCASVLVLVVDLRSVFRRSRARCLPPFLSAEVVDPSCPSNAPAQPPSPPAGQPRELNLGAPAEISPARSRLSIPSSCRRSARCRPPRRRGYGGRRRPDDSAARRAYRASVEHRRY